MVVDVRAGAGARRPRVPHGPDAAERHNGDSDDGDDGYGVHGGQHRGAVVGGRVDGVPGVCGTFVMRLIGLVPV